MRVSKPIQALLAVTVLTVFLQQTSKTMNLTAFIPGVITYCIGYAQGKHEGWKKYSNGAHD